MFDPSGTFNENRIGVVESNISLWTKATLYMILCGYPKYEQRCVIKFREGRTSMSDMIQIIQFDDAERVVPVVRAAGRVLSDRCTSAGRVHGGRVGVISHAAFPISGVGRVGILSDAARQGCGVAVERCDASPEALLDDRPGHRGQRHRLGAAAVWCLGPAAARADLSTQHLPRCYCVTYE